MSESRGRLRAAWLWFGHYHDHVGIVTALGAGAAMAVGAATNVAFWSYAGIAIYAVWYVGLFAWSFHRRTLCPRDTVDLEPMSDPERAIKRYGRELRTYHSRRQAAVPLVVMVGGIAAAILLKAFTDVGLEARVLVFAAMFMVSAVASAYLSYAGLHHDRLRPYCPHCHGGGGGFRFPTGPSVQPQTT